MIKSISNKMVAALLICFVAIFFISCFSKEKKQEKNYTYKWKLAIVYENGEKDTVNCQYNSFNGNECYLYLKVSESNLFSSTRIDPCIIIGCGLYSKAVACGIRKYEILSFDTIPLKTCDCK